MGKSSAGRVSVFLFIFFIFPIKSQGNKRTVDSLKNELSHTNSGPIKIKILQELSKATDCIDSTTKLGYAKNALGVAISGKLAEETIQCNLLLGRIYDNCTRNSKEALQHFDNAAKLAAEVNDTSHLVDAYIFIGNIHKTGRSYPKAIDYYNQALSLQPKPDVAISLLGNMGLIYVQIADFKKAMDCYTRSYKILDQSIRTKKNPTNGDSLVMAGLLLGLGNIYDNIYDSGKALQNFNTALYYTGGNKDIEIMALMGKGETYASHKDYKKAVTQYELALTLCSLPGHSFNKPIVSRELTKIYLATGEIKMAQAYAKNALGKELDETQKPSTYIVLAKVSAQLNDYNTAITYLKDAIAIARQLGQLEDEEEAWHELSGVYEGMKNNGEAYGAYKQYIVLRDSISDVNKSNELIRTDLEASFARKEFADSLKNQKQAESYEFKIQTQRKLVWGGYIGVALVLLLSFFIYRNYSQQKEANTIITRANDTITKEKQVSEGLLLNILPEEVAKELKAEGNVQAKMFDNVTVMFTDFINFTSAGERFTPHELVAELHACFRAFDEILAHYNIEKIKTVGDAYLAVSGLPQPCATHASEMIKAALQIADFMKSRKLEIGDRTFDVRIGLHSGPVVAGIVGVTKFAYDIWGDTVNTAARMEQYSENGRVNVSESTWQLIKDEFTCIPRGKMHVKNKGEMAMYFVEA